MSEQLEKDFHIAMLQVYDDALRCCGYKATRFLKLVREVGGLAAVKTLLHRKDYSDGLVALWEGKCLDVSMEALVLNRRWTALFTDEDRAVAYKRLVKFGYIQEPETV